MLGRSAAFQARVLSRRVAKPQFHTLSCALNEAKVTPPKLPKKKSHPIRNFVLKVLFATGVFYGAGVYASLESDTFSDYFTEYVPLADEILQAVEDNKKFLNDSDLDLLKKKIQDLKDKTVSIPQQGAITEKINGAYEVVKAKSTELIHKPEEKKETAISVVSPVIKKLSIPKIEYSSNNAEVNALITKLNSLISSVNDNSPSATTQKLVENVSKSIAEISDKVKQFEADNVELAKNITDKFTSENAVVLKKKENELIEKFLTDFNSEVNKIKAAYEKTLEKDIAMSKDLIQLEYENKLKAVQIQQLNEFSQNLTESIEMERDGKLKNLNALYEKVKILENFEVEIFKNFEKFTKYNELTVTLSNLKKLVFNSETYQNNLTELDGAKILEEISKLVELTKSTPDDLVSTTIQSIPTESIRTTGLLSNAQLIQRWNLLVPELRSASLLPPNAGLLGHLSARFFSYFLISKQGNVPTHIDSEDKPLVDGNLVGNDIESVISRVNYKLSNGDLDDAIETVSSLKGWGRKLSNDWLIEARKKLELEFLVDLLETEIKYSY
ncbi:Mic60 protein [Saccharomycopsis crataegensis]|uniref:MICOS complex subunit MIC60 n=1 Tax=Saccharomycopsis crataegensis TaxID=43959 RepID=A0AAV5QWE4_9ASCO|nr:Mic60 protein [Saccharomycopsis crataegensis]